MWIQIRTKFPDVVSKEYKDKLRDNITSILVNNLPRDITTHELAEAFGDYGVVRSCERFFLPNGEYINSGRVVMDTVGAELALKYLDNTFVMGERLALSLEPAKENQFKWEEKEYKQLDDAPVDKYQWKVQMRRWEKKKTKDK
jgi:RNA recognition motif-containing protein